MFDPLVTVVTPSYNQGRFIRATIESVLCQDYPNLEYIVMDGGSTDETASVVKDYASRLTFISEKDRGQSHAINKGFRMGRGSILSWLNSDDLYLPGAVAAAVRALSANPSAGAVYGEGNLIDGSGAVTGRFRCTEPFNLWKLVWLSDYILQQTVYFRREVLDQVGYLDEALHYTMDWDILIRIGSRYPLVYIPEEMGCLREYPEAKSFSGGRPRVQEIRDLLRRHTGRRFPPGYLTYALETYQQMCCAVIQRAFGRIKPVAGPLQAAVRLIAGTVIARTMLHAQGLYDGGWAGRSLRYMLPPGEGDLLIEGSLPHWPVLRGQTLHIVANGRPLALLDVAPGDFAAAIAPPPELRANTLHLTITASRWRAPGLGLRGGRKRLAFLLKSIRWAGGPLQPACPELPEPESEIQ